MNTDLINAAWLAAAFLTLFGFAELLYHRFRIEAEYTRKLVHIGTGLLTLMFPVFLSSHWWVLVLCASFAAILLASLKYNLLRSINAVERTTHGSLCYPVAVYGCFLAYEFNHQQLMLFYLPILILAFCDPLAALVGRRWPIGKYAISGNNKSLMGSAGFTIAAFGIALIFLLQDQRSLTQSLGYALLIALVSAIAEAISNKGYDNLSIPGSVLAISLLLV